MSSATIHSSARSALRTRLASLPGIPASRAPEGFNYAPLTGRPFVADKLVSLGSTPRAVGAIEHKFGYILTLKYPANNGTADIEAAAGALLDGFKVGSKLTYGDSTILSYGAERRGGLIEGPEWLELTVSVTLQAFTIE